MVTSSLFSGAMSHTSRRSTFEFHSTPLGGYDKLVAYGEKKAKLSWGRLIGQAVAAGWWIAMGGHISTVFGSAFYHPTAPFSSGFSKFAYGFIFPIAFMCVTFTGSELFTGNTVAMTVYALHRKTLSAWMALLKNWSVVLVFNYVGAVFAAFLLGFASEAYDPYHTEAHQFLGSLCSKKLGFSFHSAFVLGIGCNIIVCVTTFMCLMIKESVGKILIIWFLISSFCYAGFEHIIANFYTLSVCNFYSQYNVSYGDIWLHNFFAVLLGNVIGGGIMCGGTWFLLLRPKSDDTAQHPALDTPEIKPRDVEE